MQVYKTHYRGLHVGKNHYICVIKHPFLNLKTMNTKPTVKNRIKNKMLPLVIIMLIAFAGQANAQLPSYRLKNISGKTVDSRQPGASVYYKLFCNMVQALHT